MSRPPCHLAAPITAWKSSRNFNPQVCGFYDFDRFELLAVYGDGDTVFATIRARLAGSDGEIFIAEQFRFAGIKLVEVRLHICDDAKAAERLHAPNTSPPVGG